MSGVQRGRPRIRDDDPTDPNRGNGEILRQRQRARQRREKEREQRTRAARFAAECEQLRKVVHNVQFELATTRHTLREMSDSKERLEFDRACDKLIIEDLRREIDGLKWRLNEPNAAFYAEQKIFHNL